MLKSMLAQLIGKRQEDGLNRASPLKPSPEAQRPGPKQPMQLPVGAVEPPPSLLDRTPALNAVTLLVPTVARRAEFLRSTLDHFQACLRGAPIIVSDHSEATEWAAIAQLVAAYPDLDIRLEHHAPTLHFLERLNACAEVATTQYVVVHADDDFMLPAALADCVQFLELNGDYVGCQGRTFFLKLRQPRSCAPKVNRCTSRDEPDAVERVVAQCSDFTPTLYAVTRRDGFVYANTMALRHTRNVIFWQYLSSCFLLTLGKLRTLDGLYYLRLDNPDGWRATLVRQGDRSHWPHLVVAPEFSQELALFKAGLAEALVGRVGGDVGSLVDDCCLALIRRVFDKNWIHDDAEVKLLAIASDEGTVEYQTVRYCGSLSLAALTRIHGSSEAIGAPAID